MTFVILNLAVPFSISTICSIPFTISVILPVALLPTSTTIVVFPPMSNDVALLMVNVVLFLYTIMFVVLTAIS